MSDDKLDKRERAERGLEDVRAMMIEMLDEGSHKWPKANAEIDAARALEGLDGAEDVLEKWNEIDHEGEWRCEVDDLEDKPGTDERGREAVVMMAGALNESDRERVSEKTDVN